MRRSLTTSSEERRGLTLSEARVELRADATTESERFLGHAAVFNKRTAIGNPLTWGFYEQIAPGAFTKTLQEGDARFLIDHDSYYVVARASAGTLDLAQDTIGLRVDAALDDALSYVRDLKANLRNGNVTGMSFGFYVVKDDWDTEEVETARGVTAEVEVRTIREVKLIEVSAVTFPAYEDTDAGLRSLVVPALRARGDADAIARRAQFRPELAELLEQVPPRKRADLEVSEVDGQERIVITHTEHDHDGEPDNRKAIPSHSTATSDDPWDASANTSRISNDAGASTLRACYAWVDPDGDPEAKSSYKFPHHFVSEDGKVGAASTRACQNGIAVLNGGRGGADIPDADRQGVYNHLARHLRDAGLEPAELKASPGEPGETTRTEENTPEVTEPADATRDDLAPTVQDRMRARALRWGLRMPA